METKDFDHVLVLEGGRIVEQGAPEALLGQVQSRYRALIEKERALLETFEDTSVWRRFEMVHGTIREWNGNEHD